MYWGKVDVCWGNVERFTSPYRPADSVQWYLDTDQLSVIFRYRPADSVQWYNIATWQALVIVFTRFRIAYAMTAFENLI